MKSLLTILFVVACTPTMILGATARVLAAGFQIGWGMLDDEIGRLMR